MSSADGGINSRLDELQAAVLRVKLQRLDADNARRAEIASLYRSGINNPLVRIPTEAAPGAERLLTFSGAMLPARRAAEASFRPWHTDTDPLPRPPTPRNATADADC